MLTNADLTVIETQGGAALTFRAVHYVRDVYWNDCRGRTVTKGGVQIADALVVYLYETDYVPKPGDILLRGDVTVGDGSTQEAAAAAIKTLRDVRPDYAVVKQVSDCRYGGLPHIELIAR